MSAAPASPTVATASDEVHADLAHAAHCRALDERLRGVIERGAHGFGELLAAGAGADPRLVAQRVAALGLPAPSLALATGFEPGLEPGPGTESGPGPEPGPEPVDPWVPELHARDFEWYFTATCAAELAARVAGPDRSVLCLGAPTVAFGLLEHPGLRRVTLVDRNPLALRRHRGGARLQALCEDLAAVRVEAGAYDAAVFDAPWYPDALHRWLTVAATAVRPGGRVLFALMQPLHRPSAPDDRASILAHAQRLGAVTVDPGRLRYDTPRFEREALAAAGLTVPAGWRRADLVEVQVHRSPVHDEPPPLSPTASEPEWARFVVGSQVIQLDPHAEAGPGDVLSPIGERSDFRYASISTRDPRRAEIGLWTSRSRVARVRRPDVVAALLERLAEIGELRGLAATPELQRLPARMQARLLHALQVIVGRC